MKCEEVLEAKS